MDERQRKPQEGRMEGGGTRKRATTLIRWWCPMAKGAPLVLLLVAARGKHGSTAMRVGMKWIGKVEAGWVAEETEEDLE